MKILFNPIISFAISRTQRGKGLLLSTALIAMAAAIAYGFQASADSPSSWLTSAIGLALAAYLLVGLYAAYRRGFETLLLAGEKTLSGEGHDLPLPLAGGDEISAATRHVHELNRRLVRMRERIASSSDEVSYTSHRLTEHTNQVAARAHQQSDALQVATAALEQMSASIADVAQQASEAAQATTHASDLSRRGESAVNEVRSSISALVTRIDTVAASVLALEERTRQIDQSAATVKQIAEQTNLLALNAAIEAARAGEHGAGFAVVAEEVRKLADLTSKAMNDIDSAVIAIHNNVSEASEGMQETTRMASHAVEETRSTSSLLEQIRHGTSLATKRTQDTAEVTRQQEDTAHEIAKSVEQVALMAEENSLTTDDTLEIARYLTELARELKTTAA